MVSSSTERRRLNPDKTALVTSTNTLRGTYATKSSCSNKGLEGWRRLRLHCRQCHRVLNSELIVYTVEHLLLGHGTGTIILWKQYISVYSSLFLSLSLYIYNGEGGRRNITNNSVTTRRITVAFLNY